MTSALTAVAVLLLVQAGSSGPIPAPEAPPAQSAPTEVPQAGRGAGKAFSRLFTDTQERLRGRLAAEAAAAATQRAEAAPQGPPKVVCGMKVIQADPAIDPKIVKTIPGDPSGMKIRRFVPSVCTD